MSKKPPTITIYDAITDTTVTREMTPEEIAENETYVIDAPAMPSPE
jgi:hypothetical protein